MFAIFESLGRQYKVSVGDVIQVDKIDADVGRGLVFDQILAIGNDDNLKVGAPYISGAQITGEIVEQGKEKKIFAYKKKRRKGFHKKKGFRRQFSAVMIKAIKEAA